MISLIDGVILLATTAVIIATTPVFTGLYQFLLVGFSMMHTHLGQTGPDLPRVSILIPAWNEDAVIATTIERLMDLDYPTHQLRVYVIDDGSTDQTPDEVIEKTKRYPGRVIHIRRVAGGEGKAHTLNYGLDILWMSDWTEAILIMDADVIYTRSSLRRMARHLVDPEIGAVTAYIKEGSAAPNLVQRFITFEYITATGASRRAQNVLGFLACLSGGAQLHRRENMLDIGGKIFDDTLAEDTFTTFRTQLRGRKAIFEPNALVYAEEPDSLVMLWKQRLRWARGNVQITQVFWKLWFNTAAHPTLGSVSMALLWFSIFLMPVFQIMATVGLLTLWAIDPGWSWQVFRTFWIISGLVYLLVTFTSYVIDPESARKSWLEGLLFPGLISLPVILVSLFPILIGDLPGYFPLSPGQPLHTLGVLFLYTWTSASMLVAWAAKEAEAHGYPTLGLILLMIGGYGPFLCAVTFASYIKEWSGAARTWDKTVKTGKVG
ncbi:MAG: glycosyltransferase [Myxococcota bacterium]